MSNYFDQFDGDANSSAGNFFDQFDEQIQKPEKSSLTRRVLGDGAISAVKSAIAVPEIAVGIADIVTGGRAGRALEGIGFRPKEANQILDEYLSPEQKAANQKVAQADGFVDKLWAVVDNPSVIPHAVVESAALMLAGGVVGRGIAAVAPKVAPLVAGAVGEGVVMAGSAAEQIRQQTEDGLLTGKQSLAALGTGAAGAVIGAAGAKVGQKLGLGDVDTALVDGTLGASTRSMPARIAGGALAEGVLEEMPQSMAEQALQNVALDRDIGEGVGGAGAMGLVTGAAMGAGFGAVSGRRQQGEIDPAANPDEPPPIVINRGADGADLIQPTPTADNPAPVPVERPDPSNGPLSAAASILPSAAPVLDTARIDQQQAPQESPSSPEEARIREAIADVERRARLSGMTPVLAAERARLGGELVTLQQAAEEAQRAKPAIGDQRSDFYAGSNGFTSRSRDPWVNPANNRSSDPYDRFPGIDQVPPQPLEGELLTDALGEPAGQPAGQPVIGADFRPRLMREGELLGGEVVPQGLRAGLGRGETFDGQNRAMPVQPDTRGVAGTDGSSVLEGELVGGDLQPGVARQAIGGRIIEGELSPREQRALGTTFKKRGAAELARKSLPAPERFTAEQQGETFRLLPVPAATSEAAPNIAPVGEEVMGAAPNIADTASIAGREIDHEWSEFAPESGTLAIPRAQMPQIKAEHRGAMVNFLNARGIQHEEQAVPATELRPTQAEFSRQKVEQAKGFTGGDRAILVSSDGHVLDGHHQWLAKREAGGEVRVIRLKAPIRDLLPVVAEFPSATQDAGALPQPEPGQSPAETPRGQISATPPPPPANWRKNYIQARQYAKALGVPVEKGQKLAEVVAQIDTALARAELYRLGDGAAGVSAAEVAAALAASPELSGIQVVQSFEELPELVRMIASMSGVDGRSMRGVYNKHLGATYLVADNHQSVADAVYTAVHEEVGHRGIRGLLGDRLSATMERIYASEMATAKGHRRIAQISELYSPILSPKSAAEQRLLIAEEIVAHLAESGDRPGVLQRFVSKFRAALRRLFPQVRWTYNDILGLIEQSRVWLRSQLRHEQESRERPQSTGLQLPKEGAAHGSEENVSMDGNGVNEDSDMSRYSRRGWSEKFPDTVLAHPLSFLNNHPDYAAAKAGDDVAALRLARDAVTPEFVEQVQALIPDGSQPRIVPVLAREGTGDNRIPLMAAKVLAKQLGLQVDTGPIQAEKVGRTQANALERIANQPTFAGEVATGDYLILDDTLTQGGTLAQLKTHIEDNGGKVLGAAALTGKNYSRKLAIDPTTLAEIRGKYGEIEPWWRETFGYGFEGLTQSEARTLLTFDKGRLSPDEIRDRLAAAKFRGLGEMGGRATGDRPGTEAPLDTDDTRYRLAESLRAAFDRATGPTPLDPTDPFAVENRRLREEDRTLWDKAKKVFARQFAPGGLLPKSVFAEKITRDSEFKAIEIEASHLVDTLSRAIKTAYGADMESLTPAQMRPLQEALTGQVDPAIPEGVRVALVAMRQYIDRLSTDYLTIIQGKIDELQAKAGTSEQAAQAAKDAQRAFKDALGASTDPALVQALADQKAALAERKKLKKAMKGLKGLKGESKTAARQAYDEAVQAHERAKTATRKALSPELRKLASLAGEARTAANATRSAQYDAEAEAALYEKIKANIGAYVHRSYQAFDDPKWFKSVPTETLNAARQYLVDGYLEMGETDAEARRMAEVTMGEILKTGTAYDTMEAMISEGKLGAKDLSVLIKRKEIAPQIRALLGEYADPRLNFAKSATKMGRLVWNQRFLDKVREHGMGTFLFTESARPADATVQIAGEQSDVYAPLNGLWTFPEVAQSFKDALGAGKLEGLYAQVVKYNGMVKYGKTILSPTTAMRNFQSALFFSLANGHFDMSKMRQGVAAFREQVTRNASESEKAYMLKMVRLGVLYDAPAAGIMADLAKDARLDELLSGKTGTGIKVMRNINRFAQGFYAAGDDFWKVIGFENEKASLIKAGMSEADAETEAAHRIRSTYPTYSMIGKSMQWLRRFPLAGTFVSFPAEILRTSGNMLRITAADLKSDNPAMVSLGRKRALGMAMVSAGFYALAAMTAAALGVDDDEEEALRDLSPPWSKNSTFLFLGRDENGRLQHIDMSSLDPYGYLKRPLTAMLRDQPWEDAAASGLRDLLMPFFGADIAAGAIFQVLANQKPTGGQVYNQNADAVDQAQAIASHMRKALQPGFVSNAERMILASSGASREGSGQPYTVRDEMAGLLGWRANTLDAKTGLYYRAFEFTGALKQAKQTLTRELRSVNDVSDGDIREARDAAQRQYSKAFAEMARLVRAAEVSGLSRGEIVQMLRRSKVPQTNIFALTQGRVPPMQVGLQAQQEAVQQARAMQGAEHAAEVARRFRVAREMREGM